MADNKKKLVLMVTNGPENPELATIPVRHGSDGAGIGR